MTSSNKETAADKQKQADQQSQQQQPPSLQEQQQATIAQQPGATPPQPEQPLDEVPWEGGGGRFLVNGRLVDHEGRPLNKDGSLKKEDA